MVLILVRYGEMALKSSRVRKRFGLALRENVEKAFLDRGLECLIREEWGRIFIETGDSAGAQDVLRDVFGIVSFSFVTQTPAVREDISAAGIKLLGEHLEGKRTFAVKCRRKGSHGFTSQEMAAWVGEDILEAYADRGLVVNLGSPDAVLEVEIREGAAYLFTERVQGPGGFPLGTQGRLAGIVEPRDLQRPEKVLAAFYLIMKRGCRVVPHFLFGEEDAEAVRAIIGPLKALDPRVSAEFLPEALGENGRLLASAFPGGSALVSARSLEDGLLDAPGVPVFYPLAALPPEVAGEYTGRFAPGDPR